MRTVSDSLADTTVLVTGGRGFVGRALIEVLQSLDARIVATTRGAVPASGDAIDWRHCDPTDIEAVRRLMATVRPQHVVHLSSQADGRRELALVPTTLHAETVAAVNLLTAATEAGVRRIVLPASLEEPAPGEPPLSPYGAAKTATHLYAQMFHRLYGTPVVMARIFMAYGPGQPAWKLIPSTISRLRAGEAPVIESPDRLADWVYIEDVAAAFARILAAPALEGRVVDIGSGVLTSIRDVVARLVGAIAPLVIPRFGAVAPRGDTLVRTADLATTTRLTGWSPRIGLEDGLARTLAAQG